MRPAEERQCGSGGKKEKERASNSWQKAGERSPYKRRHVGWALKMSCLATDTDGQASHRWKQSDERYRNWKRKCTFEGGQETQWRPSPQGLLKRIASCHARAAWVRRPRNDDRAQSWAPPEDSSPRKRAETPGAESPHSAQRRRTRALVPGPLPGKPLFHVHSLLLRVQTEASW